VADNQESVDLYGTQGVVAQTAFPGVIALELLATGKLQGYGDNPEAGVYPAQAFSCDEFVQMQGELGFPGGVLEMDSEYKRTRDHRALVVPA
jgi:saccharopine dehydrogenase (NAD+, L-lysine-forming)